MKRLFITTFFPSSNASSTSCSKSLPASGGCDLIEQVLRNKGISDAFLLEITDVSSLHNLSRDYSLPFEPLQKYHQKLLKNKKTSTFEPLKHNSSQASILTSPSRSSSMLSSLMNESYLEEDVDDETIYSSRSASISIPSSHCYSSSSIVKSFGDTISSSIDEHFFDDERENKQKPTSNLPSVHNEDPTLSQEEKAKKELENILSIIHDHNHSLPKSALVAAFRKTINEGRLPTSPALIDSPTYKTFMINDIDSDSDFDDSPTSPVL